jgi:hypothetical protein
MKLCCIGCGGGLSLTLGGRDHVITDDLGREWIFEDHHYCGPIVLRKDGNSKSRQPGSRSRFWPAWDAWNEARKKNEANQDVSPTSLQESVTSSCLGVDQEHQDQRI